MKYMFPIVSLLIVFGYNSFADTHTVYADEVGMFTSSGEECFPQGGAATYTCWAYDASGRARGVSSSFTSPALASGRALASCRARSQNPETCHITSCSTPMYECHDHNGNHNGNHGGHHHGGNGGGGNGGGDGDHHHHGHDGHHGGGGNGGGNGGHHHDHGGNGNGGGHHDGGHNGGHDHGDHGGHDHGDHGGHDGGGDHHHGKN